MMTRTIPAPEGSTCPICELIFEACRCTGVAPLGRPCAGVADDIRREDDCGGHDGRGYERDETDRAFWQLVRTLQEMAPGYVRQPVTALSDQERKDLSDKVAKKNERSENPYPK
ncbi:hypothetical protein ACWGQ9_21085 [Streptomyces parvus]